MARNPFDSSGDRINFGDLEGSVVLFAPHEYIEEVKTVTSDKPKPVVVCDIVVLSDDNAEYHDVMIFPLKVMGRLRRNIGTGRPILGVPFKDKENQKRGQQIPWGLGKADEASEQAAIAYLNDNPDFMQPAVSRQEQAVLQGRETGRPVSGGDDRYAAQSVTGDPFANTPAPAAPVTPAANPGEDPFAV